MRKVDRDDRRMLISATQKRRAGAGEKVRSSIVLMTDRVMRWGRKRSSRAAEISKNDGHRVVTVTAKEVT